MILVHLLHSKRNEDKWVGQWLKWRAQKVFSPSTTELGPSTLKLKTIQKMHENTAITVPHAT